MLAYLPELLKGLHTSLTLTAAALLLALLCTIVLALKMPLLN
ncbi:polar amino acid ABC transporter inner membrane subunit [Plautia stali symbiont]|nr:polar amino acid ABC transporter inner membrane subunit [Plautia stali symbiont]